MNRVVQIIGTTGVGKSQLSIALAKYFHGEIINSDSMQVYKGLDIITNKHPEKDREGIPHHLLGFLDTEDVYRIGSYETDAVKIIDTLHQQEKLPVVVGGTAYYATSLLFKDLLPSTTGSDSTEALPIDDPRLDLSTEELYETLKQVDPVMATRWHPRDRRKIRRSLELFYTTGQRQSDIYAQQRESGRIKSSQVRYPTIILWLWSAQEVLDQRLDDRVEDMIRSGLFEEIQSLYENVSGEPDFTKGIYQAIGFKEFYLFLRSQNSENRNTGTEMMKAATRRYAKKQIKWIRNKLLLQCEQAGDSIQVVLLDATNLAKWETCVQIPAIDAVTAFMSNEKGQARIASVVDQRLQHLLIPTLSKEFSSAPESWSFHECPECPGFSTNSEVGWKEHLESRWHHTKVKQKQRRLAFESWKKRQAI